MSAQFPVTPSLSPSLPMNSFLSPKVQNCQPQLSGSSGEKAAAAVAVGGFVNHLLLRVLVSQTHPSTAATDTLLLGI